MIILILHMYINIKAFSLYDIYKFTWHEKSTVCSTLAVNINTKLRAAFRHARSCNLSVAAVLFVTLFWKRLLSGIYDPLCNCIIQLLLSWIVKFICLLPFLYKLIVKYKQG